MITQLALLRLSVISFGSFYFHLLDIAVTFAMCVWPIVWIRKSCNRILQFSFKCVDPLSRQKTGAMLVVIFPPAR